MDPVAGLISCVLCQCQHVLLGGAVGQAAGTALRLEHAAVRGCVSWGTASSCPGLRLHRKELGLLQSEGPRITPKEAEVS